MINFLVSSLLLLVSNSLTNGQNGTVCQKSLPRVSCVNELMERDIRNYLEDMGHSEKTSVCYWNLYHIKRNYQFALTRNKGTYPPAGDAFLQYGDDIIVIHGEPEQDYFKLEDDQPRMITMQVEDTSGIVVLAPFLLMTFEKNYYSSTRSAENSSNIDGILRSYHKAKQQDDIVSQSSELDDMKLDVSLTRAECTNRILDTEIVRYLAKLPTMVGRRFWNISIERVPDLQENNDFFVCQLFLEPLLPDEGAAYLDYGNDILIVTKESDFSLFSIVSGKDIDVQIIRNRIPMFTDFPYLYFRFKEESPIDWKCNIVFTSPELYGK